MKISLCLICFFSHNAVETLAQPANDPGDATKTSEVKQMASQLAQKATKAIEESDPQPASQPRHATPTNDTEEHSSQNAAGTVSKSENPQDVHADGRKSSQKADGGNLPGTSEMQKIEPHASSESQSLDLAAEVHAQEMALQQLRDAIAAKQRQIDDLHNDVAMLKESLAKNKSPAPVEAFLEKTAVTEEALVSGGREGDFDLGGGSSGGASGGSAPEAGDEKKSGSFVAMPSALSLIAIAGFTFLNSIVGS